MRRLIGVLILLILFSPVSWADPWVDALHAEFEEEDFAAALKAYESLGTEVPERARDARRRSVIVRLKMGRYEEAVDEAKLFLEAYPDADAASMMQGVIETPKAEAHASYVRLRKAENDALREKVNNKSISVNFNETPLRDVVAFLSDLGTNTVLLPGLEGDVPVSMKLVDVVMKNLFGLLAASSPDLKLDWAVGCEAILIGPEADQVRVPSFTKADVAEAPDAYVALKERTMTVNFPDIPLPDAVMFMNDILGVPVRIDEDVQADGMSTNLRLKRVHVESALTLMTRAHGLAYRLEDGAIRIGKED